MREGSFEGLYTFEQVAQMQNISASSLRKRVQHEQFQLGEIKKFGKTWIIKESTIIKYFGSTNLEIFKNINQEP